MSLRLSTYPHVVVVIVCEGCGRRGRYRLARLAVRFGAEADMVAVMEALVGRCRHRTPASRGCGAQLVKPDGEPPSRSEGKGEPVPRHRQSPRRAYDREGREIEPAVIANMLPPKGTGRVTARCQALGCGHMGEVDVSGWPPTMYVPDIGLRLRCGKCFARGPWTVPIHKDPGPGGITPGLIQ